MHRHIATEVDRALQDRSATSPGSPVRTVLVGPMGAGKSTVGAALASQLGLARFDSDQLFARVHGPIPEYFRAHGEPAFRAAEEELVGEVLSHHEPFVLSLGGGSVLSAQTRARLSRGCRVVNLIVDEHTALDRLDGGVGRPVLAGDPVRNWLRILREREGLYREISHDTIDTSGLTTEQVALAIIERTP
ncbi:MAG: shikimate kinase [Micrococcaceae bacterium]